MAVDPNRLRDQMVALFDTDPDDKYVGEMKKPEDSPELAAWCHYMARAILQELTDNAEIQAGIEVEDDTSTKIGATRQGPAGSIE